MDEQANSLNRTVHHSSLTLNLRRSLVPSGPPTASAIAVKISVALLMLALGDGPLLHVFYCAMAAMDHDLFDFETKRQKGDWYRPTIKIVPKRQSE